MAVSTDHGRLIGQAAKRVLAPLGCKRKGRSRLWFDDHLWWVGVIEFQPSAWARGSYLNVGAMWLWNAKEHWSFDDGYRVDSFKEFKGEDQFFDAAAKLAERAAVEVTALRQRFSSIGAVSAQLAQKSPKTIWDHFHAAVSLGVTGNMESARSELEAVQSASEHAPWVTDLKNKCAGLSGSFTSLGAARQKVRAEVGNARALLGLEPLAQNEEIWR